MKFTHGKILSRKEMKQLKGSSGTSSAEHTFEDASVTCTIREYDINGKDLPSYVLIGSNVTEANNHCVARIITGGTGVYRCTYSCSNSNQ